MKVVIFFLSLCFLLIKGNDDAYATFLQKKPASSPVQKIEKRLERKFGSANQGFPVFRNNTFKEQKEDFISLEDDDEELTFSRKYVLLAKYFVVLAYTALLACCYNYFKSRLPFCWHLSYISTHKYILQRVLRI